MTTEAASKEARPLPAWTIWAVRAIVTVAVGGSVLLGGRSLAAGPARAEGVDFYHYACRARDNLHGAADSTQHKYFPGADRFWQAVMMVFGEDLSILQKGIAGLLAINALLTGAI